MPTTHPLPSRGRRLLRFLRALGLTTAVCVAVGLLVALSRGPDLYGYVLGAMFPAAICIFSGVVGGGIHCLARWVCPKSTRLALIGGIAGFILTPVAWTAFLVVAGGESTTDGGAITMLFAIIISVLPAAAIGAMFGAGVGQDRDGNRQTDQL